MTTKFHSKKRLIIFCGAGHAVILKKTAPGGMKDKPIGEIGPCLVCGRPPKEIVTAFEEEETPQ